MVIRQLKQEEKFMAGRISGICFHERIDDLAKKRQEWEEAKEEDWGAFDEKGTLMARIINNRYTSYVDGQEIQNGGIGAVSTLPEYRNNRIWHVTENAVEVAADGTETDMEVSIQAFSQLAVGAISLDEALLREDIAISAKKEKLRSLFRRKSIFINEHF